LTAERSYARRRRETVPVLYISTEGTTEANYFNMLKKRGMGFEMQVFESKRKNATAVVEFCIDRMMQTHDPGDNDKGIAVFDIDENTAEDIENAINIAQENGILIAISNPCFETWLLSHFQKIPIEFNKDDILRKLCGHVPNYSKTADLSEFRPQIPFAISNGHAQYEKCTCDRVPFICPSTNVHCIVECIMNRKIDW